MDKVLTTIARSSVTTRSHITFLRNLLNNISPDILSNNKQLLLDTLESKNEDFIWEIADHLRFDILANDTDILAKINPRYKPDTISGTQAIKEAFLDTLGKTENLSLLLGLRLLMVRIDPKILDKETLLAIGSKENNGYFCTYILSHASVDAVIKTFASPQIDSIIKNSDIFDTSTIHKIIGMIKSKYEYVSSSPGKVKKALGKLQMLDTRSLISLSSSLKYPLPGKALFP